MRFLLSQVLSQLNLSYLRLPIGNWLLTVPKEPCRFWGKVVAILLGGLVPKEIGPRTYPTMCQYSMCKKMAPATAYRLRIQWAVFSKLWMRHCRKAGLF